MSERPTVEAVRRRLARECPEALVAFGGPEGAVSIKRPPKSKPVPPAEAVHERLTRGRRANAKRGIKQGGPCPYGYQRVRRWNKARHAWDVQMVPLEAEAAVVGTIFRRYLERFCSIERLARALNAGGIKTRLGKAWSRASVAWILKNATYRGSCVFGKIRTRGKHEAIVAPIIFNQVQAKLARQDKRHRSASAGGDA